MGSILTIDSKVKLGCNICDKCCINRGDIKITPVNVIEISRYMNISIHEFIDNYTSRLESEPLEFVIKAVGEKDRCILNDENTNMCKIHSVKPMQCVTFPLVPIYLEKDIFYNQDTCPCDDKKEIKVIDWLNGKDGIYMKYKKIYIEWIKLIELLQPRWEDIDVNIQKDIFNILYYEYSEKDVNIGKSIMKNIKRVKKLVKSICKQ